MMTFNAYLAAADKYARDTFGSSLAELHAHDYAADRRAGVTPERSATAAYWAFRAAKA